MGAAVAAPLVISNTALSAASRWAASKAFYYGTRPVTWGAYNAYKEAEGLVAFGQQFVDDPWEAITNPVVEPRIKKRLRPYGWYGWAGRPLAIAFPIPYIELLHASPRGGGPVESPQPPPPLHQGNKPHRPSKPTAVSLPKFKISSKKGSRSRKRCPPGHYWNGRRCVKR